MERRFAVRYDELMADAQGQARGVGRRAGATGRVCWAIRGEFGTCSPARPSPGVCDGLGLQRQTQEHRVDCLFARTRPAAVAEVHRPEVLGVAADDRRVGPTDRSRLGRIRWGAGLRSFGSPQTVWHDYRVSNAPFDTPLREFARALCAEHRIEECLRRGEKDSTVSLRTGVALDPRTLAARGTAIEHLEASLRLCDPAQPS